MCILLLILKKLLRIGTRISHRNVPNAFARLSVAHTKSRAMSTMFKLSALSMVAMNDQHTVQPNLANSSSQVCLYATKCRETSRLEMGKEPIFMVSVLSGSIINGF